MKNIESLNYSELNCYKVLHFPDVLIVTTDANEQEFADAFQDYSTGEQGCEAIECVLRARGFVAVAGTESNKTFTV